MKAEALSPKLILILENPYWPKGGILHHCPACNELHCIAAGDAFRNGEKWEYDGDKAMPSFTPSMNIRVGPDEEGFVDVCHYWLRHGKIEYCGDCTHDLKSQIIALPDIPDQETHVRQFNGEPVKR